MKKNFTVIFTILSALLILDSMHLSQAVAMFLLAGIIPGTNIVLSADHMLGLFTMLTGFVLARICVSITRAVAGYELNDSAEQFPA